MRQGQHFTAYAVREASADAGDYSFRLFTTDRVNRNGWTVGDGAMSYANFNDNPVVFYNHQSRELPIGAAKITEVADGAIATIDFDQEDEFAVQVQGKVDRGYIRALSAGYLVYDDEELETSAYGDGWPDVKFTDADLLEVSVVTIPADPTAVRQQRYRTQRRRANQLEVNLPAALIAKYSTLPNGG